MRPGGWGKQQVRWGARGGSCDLGLGARLPEEQPGWGIGEQPHPQYWAWPGMTPVPAGSCGGTGVCCVLAPPGPVSTTSVLNRWASVGPLWGAC